MSEEIDRRTVFESDKLTVTLKRFADEDARPEDYGADSAYDDAETRASFREGAWEFNVLVAEVAWDDVVLGDDSLGSVDHGTIRHLDEDGNVQTIECDAFEVKPAEYPEANVVVGGTPATQVIVTAIENAREWAMTAAYSGPVLVALDDAERWADPFAPHKRQVTS